MSAERLRQAATLLRERAEAATPGSWGVAPYGWIESLSDDVNGVVDTRSMQNKNNATYIATMSPPVALALADWLEDTAGSIEAPENALIYNGNAARVADAILGDTR